MSDKTNLALVIAEMMQLLGEYQDKMEDDILTNKEGIELIGALKDSVFKFIKLKNESVVSQIIDLNLKSVIDHMVILGFDDNVIIEPETS